jgi:hypothetical protein
LGNYTLGPLSEGARFAPNTSFFKSQTWQSRENTQADRHVFSNALSKISNVATALGSFPLLSSVALPVAAFASLASSTAAFFGFAKPADVSAPTKLISHNRAAWVNADGALPLVKLAHSQENAVDQTANYFPNPIDEMDIQYIVSNPAVVDYQEWKTTDDVGSLLMTIPVHPGLCTSGAKQTYTFGTCSPTPVAWVASMFKYWAGSMKYRLECVSTPFHAGRLVAIYVPDYDPLLDQTLFYSDLGDNYSVVWDITDSSHLEFEVPYIGNTPYLHCLLDNDAMTYIKNGETTGKGPKSRYREIGNGAILVFVLNKLVTPTAASGTIAILNWTSGGKDLTFAEPVLGAYRPTGVNQTRIDYTSRWYDGTLMSEMPFPVVPSRRRRELLDPISEDRADEDDPDVDASDLPDLSDQHFQSTAPSGLQKQGIDASLGSTQQRMAQENFIPMHYIDPQERAKLAFGEVITNLRTLTRRLTPAYVMYPQNVTTAGTFDQVAPTSLNVLCLDPDYYGGFGTNGDGCIYDRQIAPARVGGRNWLTECDSYLSYISNAYAFARGSRLYGVQSNPSNVINAAKFVNLPDECDPVSDTGCGTYDMRLSTISEVNTPPRQPYFRPDNTLLGYNFQNTSSGTLSSTNYTFGMNGAFNGNPAVRKSGEQGCGLVVQVPPTSNYPFKLIQSANDTEVNMIKTHTNNAPRSRRFLEMRYRPFSSAASGGTSSYTPKVWPFPMTIMEAGADDFSFGGLVPPTNLTRVAQTVVFPTYASGAKVAL